MDSTGFFRDMILPFLGEDTYLLYAIVCRGWSKAYGTKVTNPRYLFIDAHVFHFYKEDMWDRVSVFAARYASDQDILKLFDRDDIKLATEAIKYGNASGYNWFLPRIQGDEDFDPFMIAAEYGQVVMFPELDISDPRAVGVLGTSGNTATIDWMLSNDEGRELLTDWSYSPAVGAARSGHLHFIEYLEDKGIEWRSEEVISAAAEGGHVWLIIKLLEMGCPIYESVTMEYAASAGQIEVMEWLIQEYNDEIDANIISYASRGDRPLPVIKWLHMQGYPLTTDVIQGAVESGSYAAVKWLIDMGCPMDELACVNTINPEDHPDRIRIDILKLLRAEGCPWNDLVCRRAIACNNLVVLDVLLSMGAPLTPDVMISAISCSKDLKQAEWLLERGCPIDGTVYAALVHYNGNRLLAAAWILLKIQAVSAQPLYGSDDLFIKLVKYAGRDVPQLIKFLYNIGYPCDIRGLLDFCINQRPDGPYSLYHSRNREPVALWCVEVLIAQNS